jgi:hypothetical protein
MTVQTKRFIEVSDIVGLRCECKNSECKTTLLLPLGGGMNGALKKCPKCGNSWALFSGSSYEIEINGYLSQLALLKSSMEHFGFSLTLEISEDAIPGD